MKVLVFYNTSKALITNPGEKPELIFMQ
jgi:hypothetical protein